MKKLLHVGCNRNTIEDTIKYFDSSWSEVRLDINKDVKPDIIGSMTDLSNVKNVNVFQILLQLSSARIKKLKASPC